MARAENKEEAGGVTRFVGDMVKAMRLQKGWSQEQLAKRIGYTAAAVSAVETCAQPASDEMLVKLEEVLGGDLGLFEKAREYMLLEKYPRQFRNFAGMEAKVVTWSAYETYVFNGLFQTSEYARDLIGGGFPKLSDSKVEELVVARTARRKLFDREPTALIEMIVDESVLRRPFGSWETHQGQLRSLAEDAQRHNVSVQVMPLNRGLRGTHAGVRGDMTLVETKEHQHVVYMEIEDESILVSNPTKASQLAHRYAKIRSQALSPDDSLSLIERLAGEKNP
ncbi:helix-turn-helix domain-containing protein [Streptomyces beihaiensis]|uniref:Helix-turn-helix transcriptional regulator n=1 Tax=Streptomyces beihaiensis TaxID=2984495 RepID=A0ABT3TUQ3_9ACTN|nr:helix-turn-helix transcriptional regulator [Streptomyces beihaiensis]MCX3060769.1 helix-turn-helix transcriptional regulator [Streptomyces beihaiensis]